MFFRKIALMKQAFFKPVVMKHPIVQPKNCAKQDAFKKLAQKKVDAYESKASHLQDKADAIRDHYQARADAVRDHFNAKAEKVIAKCGRSGEKLAAKFKALGERHAKALEKCGDSKAKAFEKLAQKYQWKADCLKKKLHLEDDINDDDVDDDDDDDDQDDDNGDEEGTELPDGATQVKFALSVKGFSPDDAEPGLTNAFITVEVPDDGEEFTLEDAEEAMLDQLAALFENIDPNGNQGLELDQINQVSVFDNAGELLAEYTVENGEFVKVMEPTALMSEMENENAAPAADEDEDEDASVHA